MLGSNAFQDIAAEIGQYMFLWLFFGAYLPVSVIFRPVDYQTGTWVDSKRYVVVDRQPLSRGPLLAIVEGHERRSRNGRVLRGSLGVFLFLCFRPIVHRVVTTINADANPRYGANSASLSIGTSDPPTVPVETVKYSHGLVDEV